MYAGNCEIKHCILLSALMDAFIVFNLVKLDSQHVGESFRHVAQCESHADYHE